MCPTCSGTLTREPQALPGKAVQMPLVLVLACCGLRWGEAVALRVRDIEFLRRRFRCHREPSSWALIMRSVRRRAARRARCRRRSSCLTSCRASARARRRATWCSLGPTAVICRGQSPTADGSLAPSSGPGCRRSRRTICGTRARRCRWPRASMSSRCNECSGTRRRRSRWTPTATCSTTTSTPSRSLGIAGTRRRNRIDDHTEGLKHMRR